MSSDLRETKADVNALHGSWPLTLVVLGTVLFNPILALINANVTPLNSSAVIGCEALLDAAAIAISARVRDPLKTRWLGLILFIAAINLSNTIGNQQFDPKFLRDVLIIPIFALLGLSASRDSIIRILMPLQWIVLVVMIYEALRPDDFGRLFNVMGYYINTRGFQAESFWSAETSDLFVSATRPGERFLFGSLNIHRLSSVFLEPVSLGNYCVIVTMILVSLWERFRPAQKWFLVASNAMILVGCDGRFATVSILIMVAIRFLTPYLPRYANVAYLPGVLILGAFATSWLELSPEGDDFSSRTANSMRMLSQMDLAAMFGYDAPHAYQVMDSGIAYILYSQSVLCTIAIWLVIACGLPPKDRPSIVFSQATAIYVALNLLISYSAFSIKTAGLLWFVYGAMGRINGERMKEPRHGGDIALTRRVNTHAGAEPQNLGA